MSDPTAETTPVVAGTYPDPTICRVGGDYYLAHSSFEYFPGAPIWHSRDLVTWEQVGHVLTRRSQFRRGDGRASQGIYGSTLRHHDDRFWFATTNMSDASAGQVLVHTTDPVGPWSEPTFIPEAQGIDPDLCWDEDGTCYLTWRRWDDGVDGIAQARVDLRTGDLLEEPRLLWSGTDLPNVEGPHLYRVGAWWYLVAAAGGTERGHGVVVARSDHPEGPFTPCPDNPVLTRRSTLHPVQNVGHADLVQTPTGEWAAVYLGVRPRGSTPGFHVLGRETFLGAVDWVDGWPTFEPGRYEVPRVDHSFVDDFRSPVLDHRWVVPGGEPDGVVRRGSDAGLALMQQVGSAGLLCFRVRDLRWTAEAEISGTGCFVVRMDDRHWYGLEVDDAGIRAVARIGPLQKELARITAAHERVTLRIESVDSADRTVPFGDAGPDEIALSVVLRGTARELARLDGRYLSTEVASGFTGRMLALGATGTSATVHSVTYTARPSQVPDGATPSGGLHDDHATKEYA